MPLRRLYSIAFSISLALLLVFSWLLNNSIHSLTEKSSLVEHSQLILDRLQKLNGVLMDIENSQRGFLLTNDTTLLADLYAARNSVPLLLDTLAYLTRDNNEQQLNLAVLREVVVRRLQKAQEVLNRAPYLDVAQLKTELTLGNRLMEEFRQQNRSFASQEQYLLKERLQSKLVYQNVTPTYFRLIFTITTVIAMVSFFFLLRESRKRREAQTLLEMRVHSLAQLNAELQQIAYVTSHDLQEPLRKIRTFSDALVSKFGVALPDEARTMLVRVDKNVNYIRELVADLSDFANLSNNNEERLENIDLNKILLDLQKEMAASMQAKNAVLVVSALPAITGYEKQLVILFKEILSNSIKFSREAVPPEITITGNLILSDQVRKDMKFGDRNFNVITVYDNGIGFDNELSHKVFVLFQKLHGSDSPYKGKGIGLAICQRIMTNHDGFITALGDPDKGTKIQLFFPIAG